jgi:hypothetical protein
MQLGCFSRRKFCNALLKKKKKKERKKKKEKKRKKKEMTALCLDVPFLSRQWYIYAAIYWWNLL